MYDFIGAEIKSIHSSYGLLNKVATVTDNGFSFVKAFKVYQPTVTDSNGGDGVHTDR